ncbi:Dyp-type peroxidase [Rhodoblastus sp.]|uniref:Dyp-type peroxidase n=1 Tax=Rhodoblastus sp. TaxID=1962975 RepID=UPI0035ADDA72
MDQRLVSALKPDPAKWRLAAPHDTNTQGLVVSGFSDSPACRALFLEFENLKGGGAWLKALSSVAPITDSDGKDPRCAALGLTWLGLRKMGLDANILASFDRPFKEGMFQEDRLRRLGDRRDSEWQPTVIDGGPIWSGNLPEDEATQDNEARAFRVAKAAPAKKEKITPVTVHALALLYEKDEQSAQDWAREVEAALAPHGVKIVRELPLSLRFDANKIAREHFGFADGLSQPLPYAEGVVKLDDGIDAAKGDSCHSVPLGEILMGHKNAHNEVAAGPVAPASDAGRAAQLPPHPRGEGFLDLGLDGSYMVVRELKQDVAQFWRSMDKSAASINTGGAPVDADWVASRVVGRDRDGNVLCPGGVLPRDASGQPENEFSFFDHDRRGLGCPLGSHIRRGNPRDGLAPKAEDKATLHDAANSHRILRRGRKFGPDIADPRVDDGADRGLLFICLNTDIGRQFEFVQQTWVLNSNFAFLFDETDPLIGPSGGFTIPDAPLRRIVPVETFVKMAGGEYFFLPSMAALRYLEAL